MIMSGKKYFRGFLVFLLVFPAFAPAFPEAARWREIRVSELKLDDRRKEEASFARPVSIAHDARAVYVVDADDHAIRIFSKEGVYSGSFGKRGQGPGEFDSPADLDIRDNRIYVSDRFNKRIQILDGRGKFLGGFRVTFSPDQICVLEDGKIVVSHLPLGTGRPEPMVHCFSGEGKLLWEREESFFSGERVYDMFRNFLVMVKGGARDIWIIRKSDSRTITHLDGEGNDLTPLRAPDDYVSREITLPLGGEARRVLRAFCWDAAFGGQGLGLLAPDPAGRGDLGPGTKIFLFSPADGRVQGVIGLPESMNRIDLDDGRIFAFDLENRLRIFRTDL
jgi:hypothetical protein